ncbi:MAG: AAA family ATPase [Planctomycetota bacterium]|nr:AAA family ATPase [Planctomycetota bacterium]
MANAPFLRRVRLRNYKSIGECDVELGRFTILVGRNGSGKSNFLEALQFLSHSLETSLSYAVANAGGFASLMNRRASVGDLLEIVVTIELGEDDVAEYGVVIPEDRSFLVARHEYLKVRSVEGAWQTRFESKSGKITSMVNTGDLRFPEGRLLLPLMTGDEAAATVYETLRSVRIYDPEPAAMRTMSPLDGATLDADGANAAAVFSRLQGQQEALCTRLTDYLAVIVDELISIGVRTAGPASPTCEATPYVEKWLRFYFDRRAGIESFSYDEVSDGTLRALAILLAAMQRREDGRPIPVICIEEPEVGLHPAASAALVEALREASIFSQIIIATHSADILDCLDIETDRLLAVQARRGQTKIGPISEATRSIIRDHLYSAGELLRMDQLEPASPSVAEQSASTTNG